MARLLGAVVLLALAVASSARSLDSHFYDHFYKRLDNLNNKKAPDHSSDSAQKQSWSNIIRDIAPHVPEIIKSLSNAFGTDELQAQQQGAALTQENAKKQFLWLPPTYYKKSRSNEEAHEQFWKGLIPFIPKIIETAEDIFNGDKNLQAAMQGMGNKEAQEQFWRQLLPYIPDAIDAVRGVLDGDENLQAALQGMDQNARTQFLGTALGLGLPFLANALGK